MISQKCPKCRSTRIRRGYRPTRFWSKFLCRYNLLCDSCNWEFVGFAVPGTVNSKSSKKSDQTRKNLSATMIEDLNQHSLSTPVEYDDPNKNKIKVRKRVKLKL